MTWVPGSALPCIVCHKHLKNVNADNQPYGGVAFNTRGHYGSTVFDPMDGSYLVINICDDCLTQEAKQERVLIYKTDSKHLTQKNRPEPELWIDD